MDFQQEERRSGDKRQRSVPENDIDLAGNLVKCRKPYHLVPFTINLYRVI
jgi:hypothetical protein